LRIGHVIEMSMADEDAVDLLDVGGLEPERRIDASAIEICIEQQDLAVVGELEIRIAGPSDGQRARVFRKRATSRDERRRLAGGIGEIELRWSPRSGAAL